MSSIPVIRSWLFVPGNRPERFDKALASGADAVILDLEDAVPPAGKIEARDTVRRWLNTRDTTGSAPVYVRINAAATPWFDADVAALAGLPQVSGFVVPKTEDAATLHRAAQDAGPALRLVPLIETAQAFAALTEIATAARVERLMFGTIDFQLDIGIEGDGDELLFFRSQLTLASRIAGIAGPVDGVTTSLDDAALIEASARRARALGFRGKLCIHPRQVRAVHAAFAWRDDEIAWAERVVEAARASGGAAVALDGKMIDAPVIAKASEILASR
ncbi:HpcH/HpaI aldolase/citrate lyase family protein [Pandoraea apista]|uniref:HpcH/HpaI aldolase/citrate lyase family protein n=1 Tax=Pandoraea apista TaxID=93218 RepID=UPI000658BB0A|nr:CoA ester lyase [Pandoraea apista]ALS64358.1 CoA ester lyase [Pandoraea apista]RRW99445.1 CoA ester lyase [Pandoraea apista]RRX07760.1 CoA ester lyase [Pandoraea apista]CFB64000.1 Citrate lyase subunit beta-like protein [Pandoraea apista]